MNEIAQNKNIILFIDELHTLVGAGAAEGAIDASNMLKPALARGELQCVGASTLNEYRKYIEKDGALERRFQTVMVEPPTVEETVEILKGLRKKYEDHHRVSVPDDTLAAATAAERAGRCVLVLAGEPGDWVPAGFEVIGQRGDGLAERLASAFEDAGEPAFSRPAEELALTRFTAAIQSAKQQADVVILALGGREILVHLAERHHLHRCRADQRSRGSRAVEQDRQVARLRHRFGLVVVLGGQ